MDLFYSLCVYVLRNEPAPHSRYYLGHNQNKPSAGGQINDVIILSRQVGNGSPMWARGRLDHTVTRILSCMCAF